MAVINADYRFTAHYQVQLNTGSRAAQKARHEGQDSPPEMRNQMRAG